MTATLEDVDIEAIWKVSTETPTPTPPIDPPGTWVDGPPVSTALTAYLSWANAQTVVVRTIDFYDHSPRISRTAKELWCKALRSGKWKQMRRAPGNVGNATDRARCALGVLYEVIGVSRPSPALLAGWLGVEINHLELVTGKVVDWNDWAGKSFEEIADLIERKF